MPEKNPAIPCANCGEPAKIVQTVRAVQHFGKVIMLTMSCPACGFRFVDVFSAGVRKPSRFEAKVSGANDLRTKIVRSSSSTIRIPELGVTIEPAALSEGYISNLEGLLERIESAASILASSADGEGKPNADAALEKIRSAKNGSEKFTVIIEDPLGNSALIGKKVSHRALTKAEIKKLRVPMQVFDLGRGKGKRKA
ncbi:MAG: ZPR1 zinc finger domain-containing protein [Candidatus Diapherotrites archaeon]